MPAEPQIRTVLNAVQNIFDAWQCTDQEKRAILGLGGESEIGKEITPDLALRLSYVLNIHEALRTIFSSNENAYITMRNPNPGEFFNGRSPIEILYSGSLADLEEVTKRLQVMAFNPW